MIIIGVLIVVVIIASSIYWMMLNHSVKAKVYAIISADDLNTWQDHSAYIEAIKSSKHVWFIKSYLSYQIIANSLSSISSNLIVVEVDPSSKTNIPKLNELLKK